ncbi:MAG TPA: UvrD-helicase domain-containing protein, partial [Trinickia sp.]|uniref:UvrD-helicase domain-containing protein n=1 Tax=Trinickia sp. TaxID=2571163 RepID=UPI002B755A60
MEQRADTGLNGTEAAPSVDLDVFTCGLDGINQIEASAGTGKTWNICALYVRLLLERDLKADGILVVTFTKAATAELHERIRGRLAELAHAIETGDDGGDPFVARLMETTLANADEAALELAAKRVRRALSTFDQAAIHTIHAFCQRALQEAPFAAAMPFAFEMEADDAALRFELAADFWRERVEPVAAVHPVFAAWLVAGRAGPPDLDEALARRLKKPLARLRWGGGGDAAPSVAAALEADAQAHFEAACALWESEYDAIVRLLDQAQAALSRTSHKPEAVAAALDAWSRYFAAGDCHAAPPRPALKLTTAALTKATKTKFAPPEHPFFVMAETLAKACEEAEAAHRARWLSLLAAWLDEAPAKLADMKRTRRVVSFDDLLSNLHGALAAHPWLAETLRARYPAALIDEFQDTDPLQFAIFRRIFAGDDDASPRRPGPLFLVGDPKQAIYSFRAADLHTYLAARHAASARYTLAVNQRSTAPLVEACNRLFSANACAFVLDGLAYQPVRAGTRQRATFVDAAEYGEPQDRGDLRIWQLPSGDDAWSKRDAQREAAEACAAEIARLLRGARAGTVVKGEGRLVPADIAVLVRTHKQGSLVKRVLAAWGIGSVELSQASVFSTIDAEQLERVLIAIDAPGDLRRLRAALAADWFGLDADGLGRLTLEEVPRSEGSPLGGEEVPEDAATAWVERFSRYRALWHERGFAAMWRTLMRELGVGLRIIAGMDGERRLTDVNHLVELVAARSAAQPGITPTLRWVAAQRTQGGGEEAQLRLESDRDLVQIVTVHKSKGLEYAIVFCPFLNDGARAIGSPSAALPDASEYHETGGSDGTTVTVIHYGCEGADAEEAAREAAREEAAERARLIYVALTRAVYRCYLVAGSYLSSRSTKESRRSVLNWLVAGEGHDFDAWSADPPEEAALAAHWQALAGGPISIEPLPVPVGRRPLAREAAAGRHLAARTSRRLLAESWRIASFSSLATAVTLGRDSSASTIVDDEPRPDHDALAVRLAGAHDSASRHEGQSDEAPVTTAAPPGGFATPQGGASSLDASLEPDAGQTSLTASAPTARILAEDDILEFPRGAAAGECLHRLFELADFASPALWPKAIERALNERPVPTDPATARRMPAMMARLLAEVVATELAPGFTLASLDPTRRLIEWPFLFSSPRFDLSALRRLLVAHDYPDVALQPTTLAG